MTNLAKLDSIPNLNSPDLTLQEEEEEEEDAIRTSSPLELDAAQDVSMTVQRRKRVLSAIYEESPVVPAAASELAIPNADNRVDIQLNKAISCLF